MCSRFTMLFEGSQRVHGFIAGLQKKTEGLLEGF